MTRIPVLILGTIALAAAALPRAASAADVYGYDDSRPYAHHVDDEGDDGHRRRRLDQDFDREPDHGRRPLVAYDERDPERHHGGWRGRDRDDDGFGNRRRARPLDGDEGRFGRPGYEEGFYQGPRRPFGGPEAFDGPDSFGGPGPYAYGRFRPIGMRVAPPLYDGGYGLPDGGCTIEKTHSRTPVGWHKTVTHRTCYHR